MAGEHIEHLISTQFDAWPEAVAATARVTVAEPLLFCGSGSSYYLAVVAADVARRLGIQASALPSADCVLEPDLAFPNGIGTVIVISRSGATTEALWAARAARAAGARVLAFPCSPQSPLGEDASQSVVLPQGEDHTVVMIRSFTTLLMALQALLARHRGQSVPEARLRAAGPALVAAGRARLAPWFGERRLRRLVVLGGGVRWGIALEGMLKALEMTDQPAVAFVPLEYRHGPWGALTGDDGVILLTRAVSFSHDRRLTEELRQRTDHVLTVGAGEADVAWPAEEALADLWTGPLAIAPLQVLAWRWALSVGLDPDRPPNLTKVVDLS